MERDSKRSVIAGNRYGQVTVEAAFVVAAVIGVMIGTHMYLRAAVMGRMHTLGQNLGQEYVPQSTNRNQTLTLAQNETVVGTAVPKPGDPEKTKITIITTTAQDELKLTGSESVSDSSTNKLFN